MFTCLVCLVMTTYTLVKPISIQQFIHFGYAQDDLFGIYRSKLCLLQYKHRNKSSVFATTRPGPLWYPGRAHNFLSDRYQSLRNFVCKVCVRQCSFAVGTRTAL
jgi:hypothetical protein